MRNALEILHQKELDLARIRRETEALRIALPLLRDDEDELAYRDEEKNEHFELQCTGTDGFHSSARRVFATSEWEVSCGQLFLVPKPTKPDSSFWLCLREKKRSVLASMHGPARRWWYGAAVGILVVVAIVGYALGHRIGHRVPVTNSSVRSSEASPSQVTSSRETTSVRKPIETPAQRPNENQSKPGEADAPAGREVHPDASKALTDSVLVPAQAPSEAGGTELTMGRRYLQGQGVAQDHTEAARLLWKSVGKQNGDAALLLSDLYARGDDVPKDCEQARILLTLAAAHSSKTGAEELAPSSQLCDQN